MWGNDNIHCFFFSRHTYPPRILSQTSCQERFLSLLQPSGATKEQQIFLIMETVACFHPPPLVSRILDKLFCVAAHWETPTVLAMHSVCLTWSAPAPFVWPPIVLSLHSPSHSNISSPARKVERLAKPWSKLLESDFNQTPTLPPETRLQLHYVSKDGKCRVNLCHISERGRFLSDIFASFVDLQYCWFLLVFMMCYITTWFLFAGLLFSVETQCTVGYGSCTASPAWRCAAGHDGMHCRVHDRCTHGGLHVWQNIST